MVPNSERVDEERIVMCQLKCWLKIEFSAVRQKARIKWCKEGNLNSSFLHASLKARTSGNRIDSLISGDGRLLMTREDIEMEVLQYYKNLLGSSKS